MNTLQLEKRCSIFKLINLLTCLILHLYFSFSVYLSFSLCISLIYLFVFLSFSLSTQMSRTRTDKDKDRVASDRTSKYICIALLEFFAKLFFPQNCTRKSYSLAAAIYRHFSNKAFSGKLINCVRQYISVHLSILILSV